VPKDDHVPLAGDSAAYARASANASFALGYRAGPCLRHGARVPFG
jgi:hypothetical protein